MEVLKTYTKPNQKAFLDLWENAIIIFDTNTLLNVYRLPETARNDFFKILESDKIKNRIWLPFQALLEFSQNRLTVIGEQKGKFNEVSKIVGDAMIELENTYENLKTQINKLQLKKRHSVINVEEIINGKLLDEIQSRLTKFTEELSNLDRKHTDVNDNDDIGDRIIQIFRDNIGTSFNNEELKKIYTEGEERYKELIPPGYKDSPKENEKPNFYLHEDIRYLRKFGDLILWKEILQKAEAENLSYIILVTDDNKEDWWSIKRGKTLGPRYELLNEIYFKVPDLKLFHMYDSPNFMKYSKEILKIDVTEQSISEAKDLNELQNTTTTTNELLNFQTGLLKQLDRLPLSVQFLKDMQGLFLKIKPIDFTHIIIEIIYNINEHATDKSFNVDYFLEGDYLVISFINKLDKDIRKHQPNSRKIGLNQVRKAMSDYGYSTYYNNDDEFYINLHFLKSFALYIV